MYSVQSELFFRLLLKNTVRRVQIAAYPKFLAASYGYTILYNHSQHTISALQGKPNKMM